MRYFGTYGLAGILALGTWVSAVAQDTSQSGSSTSTQSTSPGATPGTSGQTVTQDPSQPATPPQAAAGTQSSVPGSTGETQVLIDPGKIYNDKTPTAWIGKSVQLQNVMVSDTNDTGNFWVGVGGKQRLLIAKNPDDPNMQALRIHKGDVVTINGVVEPATDEWAQKTRAEMGSMRDARNGSGVFLYATNITIASSTAK